MTITTRTGKAALLVAVLAILAGAFAFGHHAGRVGWEWTPVAVLAALSLSAAAGVLLLNRDG